MYLDYLPKNLNNVFALACMITKLWLLKHILKVVLQRLFSRGYITKIVKMLGFKYTDANEEDQFFPNFLETKVETLLETKWSAIQILYFSVD